MERFPWTPPTLEQTLSSAVLVNAAGKEFPAEGSIAAHHFTLLYFGGSWRARCCPRPRSPPASGHRSLK